MSVTRISVERQKCTFRVYFILDAISDEHCNVHYHRYHHCTDNLDKEHFIVKLSSAAAARVDLEKNVYGGSGRFQTQFSR